MAKAGIKMKSARNALPVIFWGICSVEAMATFVIMASIPPDPKNAFLFGYSLRRLVMFAASAGLALVFAGLAWASRECGMIRRWLSTHFSPRIVGWGLLIAVLLLVGCLFLLVFTPPRMQGAMIERLQPFLILAALVISQGLLTVWLLQRGETEGKLRAGWTVLRADLSQLSESPWLGYGLLAASFLVGLMTVFFSYYNMGDEGDTIAVGWLIAQGKVLYRDIFSHHFPFPYLWVGLVIRLFGPSIFVVRLSVVVLRTILFAIAMWHSRRYIAGGLSVFVWSLVCPLFLGNMLMYDTFGALLLMPVVLIVFAALDARTSPSSASLAFIGLLLGLAVLSDPVTIAPGFLLLAALGINAAKKKQSGQVDTRQPQISVVIPASVMAGTGLVYMLSLVFTGALSDFFKDAIWFNQVIYRQYGAMPGITDLFQRALTGLDLFNPYWRTYTGLYYQWTSYVELDQWVFTSLFFRLAVVGFALFRLSQRAWFYAALVYILGSVLIWRASFAWHAQSFIFYAIICAVALLDARLVSANQDAAEHSAQVSRSPVWSRRVGSYASGVGAMALAFMFFWLGMRGAQFWVDHRAELRYEQSYAGLEGNGAYYRAVTCHQPDARILIYPFRPLDYMAAGLNPAARYLFMFPWVADVGEDEVIADLERSQDQPVLVYLEKNITVGLDSEKQYLNKLAAYLDQTYHETEPNAYLSPELKRRCDSQRQEK